MLTNQLSTIQKYVDSLSSNIGSAAPVATGNLKSSIQGNYSQTSDGFELTIDGAIYGIFQDKGVNGTENSYGSPYTFSKMPPISAFGGYDNPYAVARSIYKKGIKPKNFIEPTLDRDVDNFGKQYAESLWDDYKEEDDKTKPKQSKK